MRKGQVHRPRAEAGDVPPECTVTGKVHTKVDAECVGTQKVHRYHSH